MRKYGKRRVITKRRPKRLSRIGIKNLGQGVTRADTKRVIERQQPHKVSVVFNTLSDARYCSPMYYDKAYQQTYTNALTRLEVQTNSTVFKNYAARYNEYKVDKIAIKLYYNQDAPAVDGQFPPNPIDPPISADEYFNGAFFYLLYNPEKDTVPGEPLATNQFYDQLVAHPSTQIFRFRPPYTGNNEQKLIPCFSLDVKPKILQSKIIDGTGTNVMIDHPYIDTTATKFLYCGGLWIWCSAPTNNKFAPLFFAEITYHYMFRDSKFTP